MSWEHDVVICWFHDCNRLAEEFRLLETDDGWRNSFCWCSDHADSVRANEKVVSKRTWLEHKLLWSIHAA